MDIIIDGIEYTPKNSADSKIKIVVLQRGWVFVGKWERTDSDCKLTDASVIRKWGTTDGLGELVDGPANETILDKAGTVQFDFLTVVCTIDCEGGKWESVL